MTIGFLNKNREMRGLIYFYSKHANKLRKKIRNKQYRIWDIKEQRFCESIFFTTSEQILYYRQDGKIIQARKERYKLDKATKIIYYKKGKEEMLYEHDLVLFKKKLYSVKFYEHIRAYKLYYPWEGTIDIPEEIETVDIVKYIKKHEYHEWWIRDENLKKI